MRGVESALHSLQIVALFNGLGHETVGSRRPRPFEIGRRRHVLARAHVGPDYTAAFDGWISENPYPHLHRRVGWFVRHVDAVAAYVEFPAVIDAAKPAFLVAAEEQGGSSMWTMGIDETDASLGVAKRDEIFAQEAHSHR